MGAESSGRTANVPGPPLSLCAWVPYPLESAPSQRYRIEQWKPYLEDQGISVALLPFASLELLEVLYRPGHLVPKALRMAAAVGGRAADCLDVRGYDAVLVHRAACLAGPAIFERVVAAMRPLVFDFDDAIHLLHSSEANRWTSRLKFPGKTGALCRMSRHVVVGNDYLATYAKRFNRQVTVVPSSVDTDVYRPVPREPANGRLVLGWMGSSTSQTYLETFAPVLRQLIGGLELRVVSDRKPELPGIPHTWRPWSPDDEVKALAGFDIGVMPMPDDEWSRGKGAMKALLYMAMGIPVVCSPVGTTLDVVRHGENGLLATSAEEWVEAVGTLAADPVLRRRLGQAGRATVEERYSRRRSAALFAQVVRDVVRS